MKRIQFAVLAGVCASMFSCSEQKEPVTESLPESEQEIITRVYKVSSLSPSESDENDPFQRTGGAGNSQIVHHNPRIAEEVLKSRGITFPAGASASNSGLPFPGIMMMNTSENHKKLQAFIEEIGVSWEIVDASEIGANKTE